MISQKRAARVFRVIARRYEDRTLSYAGLGAFVEGVLAETLRPASNGWSPERSNGWSPAEAEEELGRLVGPAAAASSVAAGVHVALRSLLRRRPDLGALAIQLAHEWREAWLGVVDAVDTEDA